VEKNGGWGTERGERGFLRGRRSVDGVKKVITKGEAKNKRPLDSFKASRRKRRRTSPLPAAKLKRPGIASIKEKNGAPEKKAVASLKRKNKKPRKKKVTLLLELRLGKLEGRDLPVSGGDNAGRRSVNIEIHRRPQKSNKEGT